MEIKNNMYDVKKEKIPESVPSWIMPTIFGIIVVILLVAGWIHASGYGKT